VAELGAGWPHGSQDAIGQAGEFLVWANLITQSGGGLHIFLPMLDRGIDAVVHRLKDGAYIAVQVKTRTVLHDVEFPIAVYENHLFTADQLVIGVHLDGDRLGPFALVADSSTFKKKAARIEDRGRILLVADVPTRPIPGHRWTEDLVALDHLAERLVAEPTAAASGARRRFAAGWPWARTADYFDRFRTTRPQRSLSGASRLDEPSGSRSKPASSTSLMNRGSSMCIGRASWAPRQRF
jgi:hypothetical protein